MTIGGRLRAFMGHVGNPAEEQQANVPVRSSAVLPVARTLCWATHEEAERLGVAGSGTRHWAYRWIEEHVKALSPVGVLADIGGGGVDAVLASRLAPHAARVLVLDQIGSARRRGNIEEVVIDLERGLRELDEESIDVFVTASSLEHLTAIGQQRVFAGVARALKPKGVLCGSISYITRLDDDVIRLLQSDPAFAQASSPVQARVDLKACLAGAPRLRPPFEPVCWSLFPGFEGFEESRLLTNAALVSNNVGSHGAVRCLPEVDALRLAWYELGLYLQKTA